MEVGNRDGRWEWDEGDPACAKENISLFSLPGGNLSVAPCRKSSFTSGYLFLCPKAFLFQSLSKTETKEKEIIIFFFLEFTLDQDHVIDRQHGGGEERSAAGALTLYYTLRPSCLPMKWSPGTD